MKTPLVTARDSKPAAAATGRPTALTRAFAFRLPILTLLVSVLVREYTELRLELSRINAGEPGYVGDWEVIVAPPASSSDGGIPLA